MKMRGASPGKTRQTAKQRKTVKYSKLPEENDEGNN